MRKISAICLLYSWCMFFKIAMEKNKMDMLVKDWRKFQHLRITNNAKKMVVFKIQVTTEDDEFYGEMKVTKDAIIIIPADESKLAQYFTEGRLQGVIEENKRGLIINLRFNRPSYKIMFVKTATRDHALKLIRKFIGDESSESSGGSNSSGTSSPPALQE